MSGSGIRWAICKSVPRYITMPASHHSVFFRPDAFSATQPTASEHWRLVYLCFFWKLHNMNYKWSGFPNEIYSHNICSCVCVNNLSALLMCSSTPAAEAQHTSLSMCDRDLSITMWLWPLTLRPCFLSMASSWQLPWTTFVMTLVLIAQAIFLLKYGHSHRCNW